MLARIRMAPDLDCVLAIQTGVIHVPSLLSCRLRQLFRYQ